MQNEKLIEQIIYYEQKEEQARIDYYAKLAQLRNSCDESVVHLKARLVYHNLYLKAFFLSLFFAVVGAPLIVLVLPSAHNHAEQLAGIVLFVLDITAIIGVLFFGHRVLKDRQLVQLYEKKSRCK